MLKIGLQPERSALYQRINRRAAWMFEQGLLAETKALLESGVPPHAKPMLSLGYKQALAVLGGEQSLADAVSDCQTKTRQYAKRQLTWFRRERNVHWIAGFGSDSVVQAEALHLVDRWRSENGDR